MQDFFVRPEALSIMNQHCQSNNGSNKLILGSRFRTT